MNTDSGEMENVQLDLPITQNGGLRPLTVSDPTTCEGRCARQSRAVGQYAVVTLKLTPAPKEDAVSLVASCDPVDQSGSVYKEDGIEYFRKGIARGIAMKFSPTIAAWALGLRV